MENLVIQMIVKLLWKAFRQVTISAEEPFINILYKQVSIL